MTITTYRAHDLTGEQYGDGPVDWYDDDVHVGTTRNGEGYEVTGTHEIEWIDEDLTSTANDDMVSKQ
jgi:hypothetical protein